MDALRAEMDAQKARTAALKEAAGAGKRKFVRRGDLAAVEAVFVEERRQAIDAKLAERAAAERSVNGAVELIEILTKKPRRGGDAGGDGAAPSPRSAAAALALDPNGGGAAGEGGTSTRAPLPVDEVVARLRAMGQPVTFFGELELERYGRMRKCEEEGVDDDFGISKGHGGELRNVFLDKGDDDDAVSDDDDDDDEDDDGTPKKKGSKKKASGAAAGGPEADAAAAAAAAAVPLTAEQKVAKQLKDEHGRVREYFKGLLRGWEAELNGRPDHVKRTAQGKIDTKTQKQCKDYIRPLFKLCKRRDVPSDILASLIVMIQACQEGEFVKANDAYILTAIGNAAWPIGITSVGMHARSAHDKMQTGQIAHVMNNEMQRKYLQSVKRLMRFEQNRRDDVLPSKKVM